MDKLTIEDAAFVLFRDRLGREAKYLLHDIMRDKKYWNNGNCKFWDYWQETVSDRTKNYYQQCVAQALREKDGQDFNIIPLT